MARPDAKCQPVFNQCVGQLRILHNIKSMMILENIGEGCCMHVLPAANDAGIILLWFWSRCARTDYYVYQAFII